VVVAGVPAQLTTCRLGTHNRTVKLNRSHALERLGVDSVAELLRLGAAEG
jgi:FixJ family two-component response regulator